jgi:hypothetical protein
VQNCSTFHKILDPSNSDVAARSSRLPKTPATELLNIRRWPTVICFTCFTFVHAFPFSSSSHKGAGASPVFRALKTKAQKQVATRIFGGAEVFVSRGLARVLYAKTAMHLFGAPNL